MDVDPTMSQNTIVTVFRTSSDAPAEVDNEAAQDMQNRARAGFSWPHSAHTGTVSSLGRALRASRSSRLDALPLFVDRV
jgi:hypothetical protein